MPSAKKVLIDFTKDAGMLAQTKKIWREHPVLEQVSVSFADYVGIAAQDRHGTCLVQAAILGAVKAYELHEESDADRDGAVNAFMQELVLTAIQVFNQAIAVETQDGAVRWMPWECPFSEFLGRHPGGMPMVYQRKPSFPKALAIAIVLIKIVPYSLLESAASQPLFEQLAA